jgi:multiple sugar transport system substrate-binding protein
MFYNKDMFDAAGIPYPAAWPPMTVEEFADIACRLTDTANGVWGTAFGSTILPWEMSVSPDGRTAEGYINSPETVHQVDILSGIIRDGCAPTANVMDPWDQGADYFARGALAMAITDFGSTRLIEKAGINYGITGIPTPPGVDPYFDVWADNTGVLKDSAHPEEAKAFIAFLATEGQRIGFETDGSIPLDNALAEEFDWAQGIPGRIAGLEVLSHARPSVFIPDKWNAWGPFYDAWDFIVSGEKTTQQALDDAAPAIQENLDSAWEVWESQGS